MEVAPGVEAKTEGNKIVVTVDMNKFLSPLLSQVPVKRMSIKADGSKVVVEAEIDEEELIRRAHIS